jgi:anti-anti-sigma factor
MKMDIRAERQDQVSVISITGSVDAMTAGELSAFLTGQLRDGQTRIVIDLTQVDFLSSAGLRAILAALKESRQEGGDLRLAAAQPGVDRVLHLSGFTTILKAYPTVDEAARSFSPPGI